MSSLRNQYQQPIGAPMPGWVPRPRPQPITLPGKYCWLEPLDPARHAADLHAAYRHAPDDRDWTYLFFGPFAEEASLRAHLDRAAREDDPLTFTVLDRQTKRAVGTLALMRIDSAHGVIEVGHVVFSPLLQRTPISTEAQYLLLKYAFEDLGYRRYEWKCDSLNEPSRRAAERLGFTFEGIFRQAIIYKGRTRDTAWYSILDREWPALRTAFTAWLAPENFDTDGWQRKSFAHFRQNPTAEG